ncbi:MAG: TetR/AcrR family transcriptional regulator [Bacteroidota bacterium]|nr:TetR/AcrR family transcriptional regulator [Bacteroidota bacterium]
MENKSSEIFKKAGKVFFKYGIRSVSMDDICREIGISKKTLYKYVKNKGDLIDKILELDRNNKNEFFLRNIENLNAIDILLEVSKMLSKIITKVNPYLMHELSKYYPEIHQKHRQLKMQIHCERIERNLKKGITEGLYRKDIDIKLTSRIYIKKIEGMTDENVFSPEIFSFERIFEEMFVNYIRGISNQKGIEYFEKKRKSLKFKI